MYVLRWYYKIKNILTNIDALKEYLICLDHQNTDQINELEHMKNEDINENEKHDVYYYISQKGLKITAPHSGAVARIMLVSACVPH